MSLSTNVSNLATRIATEVKTLRTMINGNAADLSALTTTAKSNLVAAINEIDANSGSSVAINDATTALDSVWSSSKTNGEISTAVNTLVGGAGTALDTLNELALALGSDPNFATTMTTALGNRVRVDVDTQGLNATQQLNARTNIQAVALQAFIDYSASVGPVDTNYVAVFNAGLV
jgi:hypothetical protein